MSFWKTKNGKPVDGSEKNSFASGSGAVIPNGTTAPAIINGFELKTFNGNSYYQVDWKIIDGDFVNRHVWQNIYPFEEDADRQARALNMMMRLFKLAEVKLTHDMAPTNEDLYPMLNKQMGIKIGVWKSKEGDRPPKNVINEVHKFDAEFVTATGAADIEFTKRPSSTVDGFAPPPQVSSVDAFIDGDIPF